MAILRTLCRHGHTGPVTFLHYSHTEAGMIYRDELASIAAAHPNVRVVRSFTTEPGRGEVDGLLTVEQLSTIEPMWSETDVCVRACSPDGRRHRAVRAAGSHGRCHTEAFTLPQFVAEAGRSWHPATRCHRA